MLSKSPHWDSQEPWNAVKQTNDGTAKCEHYHCLAELLPWQRLTKHPLCAGFSWGTRGLVPFSVGKVVKEATSPEQLLTFWGGAECQRDVIVFELVFGRSQIMEASELAGSRTCCSHPVFSLCVCTQNSSTNHKMIDHLEAAILSNLSRISATTKHHTETVHIQSTDLLASSPTWPSSSIIIIIIVEPLSPWLDNNKKKKMQQQQQNSIINIVIHRISQHSSHQLSPSSFSSSSYSSSLETTSLTLTATSSRLVFSESCSCIMCESQHYVAHHGSLSPHFLHGRWASKRRKEAAAINLKWDAQAAAGPLHVSLCAPKRGETAWYRSSSDTPWPEKSPVVLHSLPSEPSGVRLVSVWLPPSSSQIGASKVLKSAYEKNLKQI